MAVLAVPRDETKSESNTAEYSIGRARRWQESATVK